MRYPSLNRVKNDFLTIPDAPNYEINSQLILRNKSTGRILKPAIFYNKPYYKMRFDGKEFLRSAISARCQAVAAANPSDSSRWTPVPSLGGKYEFSSNGNLRNASSKKILKKELLGTCAGFHVFPDGKLRWVSLKSLMWEIHGITCQSLNSPVSCSAFKNGAYHKFLSLRACSRFIASSSFFSSSYVMDLLIKRQSLIGGWNIKYAPRDFWSADKEAVSKKMLQGVGK